MTATKPGERILVSVSGGENSVGLVHMLQQGIVADHKKLLFTPLVLWIDEGCVFGLDMDQRRQNADEVIRNLSSFGFSVNVVLLEDYNTSDSELINVYQSSGDIKYNATKAGKMSITFKNIKDKSSKEEFLIQIMRGVMLAAAKSLDCGKVLTGETGTRLAVELMSSVASGVGGGLPHRVGFRDSREEGVVILRPMRELSSKEVSLYCVYNNLVTWHGQEVQGVGDTIRNVTQEFLVGLQDNFPSTIPTVNRTGDKLTTVVETEDQMAEDIATCCLCGASLDTDADTRHNALQATQYSSFISAGGGNKDPDDNKINQNGVNKDGTECCGEGDGSCQTKKCHSVTLEELMSHLCYTCRRTFDKIESINDIPEKLLDRVKAQIRRSEMKNEISDFLL